VEWGVFVALTAVAVGSALTVIVHRNPIYSAIALVVTFLCLGGYYILLQAQLVAAVHVIVYAGAIMVLFLFAIMVLIPGREELGADPLRWQRLIAVSLGLFLLVEVGFLFRTRLMPAERPSAAPGGIEAVGRRLFTDYLFPFEVTSVLLLAALVGVLVLARRKA